MSDDERETRDKVIRLEEQMRTICVKFDRMERKMDEVHNLMMKGRGAWWMLMLSVGLVGFVSAKLAPLIPWMGK